MLACGFLFADKIFGAIRPGAILLLMTEETAGSIQVSATEGGQVTVKGDVVGRDKITQIIESAKPLAPHQLPPPPPDFLGRETELHELLAASQKHSVIGLHGLGGVGKTALALKLAEHLAPSCHDAQFYLDLQGAGSTPWSRYY